VVGGVLDLRLTPARYERFLARLQALLREFETDNPGPWPGTQVYKIMLLAHPDSELPSPVPTPSNSRAHRPEA
jgi:hypothetical protein